MKTQSRKGPTGVGHCFEQELGASESNIPIPDIGGRVEMKGTRRNANSLITLFTFNRGVWKIKHLKNEYEEENVAEWSTYVIAGKFMTKLDRLLLIFADNKIENDSEHFHFNEAYLLEEPTAEKFLEAFDKSELMIDIRMHLKESGGVRNHGTAFRISEKHLIDLHVR